MQDGLRLHDAEHCHEKVGALQRKLHEEDEVVLEPAFVPMCPCLGVYIDVRAELLKVCHELGAHEEGLGRAGGFPEDVRVEVLVAEKEKLVHLHHAVEEGRRLELCAVREPDGDVALHGLLLSGGVVAIHRLHVLVFQQLVARVAAPGPIHQPPGHAVLHGQGQPLVPDREVAAPVGLQVVGAPRGHEHEVEGRGAGGNQLQVLRRGPRLAALRDGVPRHVPGAVPVHVLPVVEHVLRLPVARQSLALLQDEVALLPLARKVAPLLHDARDQDELPLDKVGLLKHGRRPGTRAFLRCIDRWHRRGRVAVCLGPFAGLGIQGRPPTCRAGGAPTCRAAHDAQWV
mmetsp:Transcript_2063/g.6186  ORF Transcript_2063/g.6186 Transcript_2063/m.6186 type:complete len:343 (+) Transcript_2063:3094-4122(+)